MDKNTFTGGVVPGGLTDHTEIKILICFVLSELDAPLSHDDLLEALAGKGDANYFESASALSDLVEMKHISQVDHTYSVLTSGKEIAKTLIGDVPFTVRERVLLAAKEFARRNRNRNYHKVSMVETDNGHKVRCTVCDSAGNELFAVELDAPTKRIAQRIRENFVAHAEDIMRFCIVNLVEEDL